MSDVEHGIVTVGSVGSVTESLDRVEHLARTKGMTIFARIDFSRDAAAVGMNLRMMQLLVLGNPTSGTPLMQASAVAGLDLPLKVLAWQDDSGACRLSFNRPEYLQQRHDLPSELLANIAGLGTLIETAARG